ncbi:uncharacterized protein DS421_9g262070 [Arachis hypogaea]|nr:uncharacterized protein DS421_9g262070 [Arachis hypogaea]
MEKEEKTMAKNGVTHTIAMLIIGMIICFVSDESYNTIGKSYNIVTVYYSLSPTMISCMIQCQKRHPDNPVKRNCCVEVCHDWFWYDKEQFDKCIKKLSDSYVK